MLRPVNAIKDGEKITIGCVQWENFPPAWATVPDRKSPEDLRASGLLDESEYSRFKIWERVCGLVKMEPEKCLSCTLCRRVEMRAGEPFLVSFDGKQLTKVRDLQQAGSRLHYKKQAIKVPR